MAKNINSKGDVDLDIEVLKTFEKLAEVKNIQKAADALFISQSSVVNRVRVFEREVGSKVFYRHGRGIKITTEGEHLLHYIKKTISILNDGIENVKNNRNSPSDLKIASVSTTASYFLPSHLQSFHKKNPDIDINVRTAFSTTIIDWVLNGDVDLGLIKGPFYHSSIKSFSLSADPIVLIVHIDHPWANRAFVTAADFMNETLLPLDRQSQNWSTITKWFSKHNIHPNIAMEFDHVETIKQMVFQNLGVGFVPSSVIDDSESKTTIKNVPVSPPINVNRETLLICHSKTSLSPYAQAFWDFITGIG